MSARLQLLRLKHMVEEKFLMQAHPPRTWHAQAAGSMFRCFFRFGSTYELQGDHELSGTVSDEGE